MNELLAVEQRLGFDDDAPWVREGGRTIRGRDGNRRLVALKGGLDRHPGVRWAAAEASDDDVEQVLRRLHEPDYLEALRAVRSREPVVMPEYATPGLAPDIPVCAPLVAAAQEGVRTAVTAASAVVAGARLSYAVCRPPGHHAGPAWYGGYCYLNNAAAAVRTLLDGGFGSVGVLDLDLHYPNGTAALVADMEGAVLHSLHAAPVTNLPPDAVLPWAEGERVVAFADPPDATTYLEAVEGSLAVLAGAADAFVLSLGFDTVAGDPHGTWGFSPPIFARVGRLVAARGLPVCIVQEGGYALRHLGSCAYALATGLLTPADGPIGQGPLDASARRRLEQA